MAHANTPPGERATKRHRDVADTERASGRATEQRCDGVSTNASASHCTATLSNEDCPTASDTTSSQPETEADWDARYSGGAMWSGNPNGSIVAEVADLTPGRALDVAAGEGADAMWLTEHGWNATAADISQRALDRARAEAERRGLALEYRHIDAGADGAFDDSAYDLVTASYASIPRTPDNRALANILAAVKPGGTLLVVDHDLESAGGIDETPHHQRPFDRYAYVRVESFAKALADSPDWTIEKHETRPRPAGAASTHHVSDVLLRARRSA